LIPLCDYSSEFFAKTTARRIKSDVASKQPPAKRKAQMQIFFTAYP
jgi:hypothetical protein